MKPQKNNSSNWHLKKLGEICDFVGGGTPDKKNPAFWNGEIPWASIKDIKGKYLSKTNDYITKLGLDSSAANLVQEGEIVLATRISPGRPILSKIVTAINQDLKIVKPKADVSSLFLYYAFLNYEREIVERSSGTTVQGITLPVLKDIDIMIPSSIDRQTAIVSKIEELFSDIDKGIEELKKAQEQLKVYRQSVLKWAFEGRLTNEVKDGELPEGWELKKISDLCKVVRGGSPRPAGDPKYYDGTIPFLKVADITKDSQVYLTSYSYTIKEAGLKNTRLIFPNTLLLSNSGATLGVPKICKIEATINDGIAAFLDLDQRTHHYLYYFWISKTLELRNINMGAGQPNLNTDLIKNYQVPYCSFEEQNQIVQEIESRLSVADKLQESIEEGVKKAEALKMSVLRKAFRGELI